MRTIALDALSFSASPNEKKFILLRVEQADDHNFSLPKILNRQVISKITGVCQSNRA
jgi:hypothetical protein